MDLLVFNQLDGCVRLSDGSAVRHPPLQIDAPPITSELCSKRNHFAYWKARGGVLYTVSLSVSVRNRGQGVNQSMQKKSGFRGEYSALVAYHALGCKGSKKCGQVQPKNHISLKANILKMTIRKLVKTAK